MQNRLTEIQPKITAKVSVFMPEYHIHNDVGEDIEAEKHCFDVPVELTSHEGGTLLTANLPEGERVSFFVSRELLREMILEHL